MSSWALITYWFIGITMIAYVLFFVVITIGGAIDLTYLIKTLKSEVADPEDDGRAKKLSEKTEN